MTRFCPLFSSILEPLYFASATQSASKLTALSSPPSIDKYYLRASTVDPTASRLLQVFGSSTPGWPREFRATPERFRYGSKCNPSKFDDTCRPPRELFRPEQPVTVAFGMPPGGAVAGIPCKIDERFVVPTLVSAGL